MKVKIGKFIYRWSTNSLDNLWYKLRYNKSRWERSTIEENKLDNLFEKFSDFLQDILNATINKLKDKQKQKIKVKIEPHDIWATDYHLAQIILPMLKRLKEHAHGTPFTDDEDVPEELRSTVNPSKNKFDVDDNFVLRWQWILNELIWTFEQLVDNTCDDQFYAWEPITPAVIKIPYTERRVTVDYDAMKSWNKRIDNGTKLFGKYFRSLSD